MPITLIIIAATCVASYAAFKQQKTWWQWVLLPERVFRQREYWRLVTSGFIHADMQHLLFNMITLYFFGRAMEGFFVQQIGTWGYVAFYFGALVVSSWPSASKHRHDPHYASLGASGAVSAVLFAYILLQPWSLIFVFVLPVPAIIYAVAYIGFTIYMNGQQRDRINHSAHLWGALYGIVFMLVMEPRILPYFLQALAHPRLF